MTSFFGLIALQFPQSADAYALTGNKWISGAHTYCKTSSVTAHTNWSNLISQDVAQYNALGYRLQPKWSSSCSAGYTIKFLTQSMDASLCGHTDMGHSGGLMINATVEYTTRKSFYDSATDQSDSGHCSFQWTTLHEFGHSQGLAHTSVSTAVMTPKDNNKRTLQADDKNGLKAIYN